ncbi:MAG: nucleotidyltransferase domain-containing protein [Bacteroidota bacterium]|nr:nucleotidyltransferase domain-containing protein [Bacteroidota bacterium]
MLTRQDIIRSVNDFVESAKKENIVIEKILLFGSYAKGSPHKYSDIDLAVFSQQFTNNHFENNKAIQFTKRLPQMQLHLYPLKEFEENLFVSEIKKHAIDLTPMKKLIEPM